MEVQNNGIQEPARRFTLKKMEKKAKELARSVQKIRMFSF
jgi:hypothetical protein